MCVDVGAAMAARPLPAPVSAYTNACSLLKISRANLCDLVGHFVLLSSHFC